MPLTAVRRPAHQPTHHKLDLENLPPLLTRREVTDLFRISEVTLALMTDLPNIILGRRTYRWRRDEVLRYLGLV